MANNATRYFVTDRSVEVGEQQTANNGNGSSVRSVSCFASRVWQRQAQVIRVRSRAAAVACLANAQPPRWQRALNPPLRRRTAHWLR
jgi:hypothetical protein